MAFDVNGALALASSIASAIGKGAAANREANAQTAAVAGQQERYGMQKEAYEKQAALTPAQISAKILELKQPLSEAMKRSIMQDIGNAMALSGASSAPGIIQEAIARALATADIPLLETATNAFFANQADTQKAMPDAPQMPYFTGGSKTGAFDSLMLALKDNPNAISDMFKTSQKPVQTSTPYAGASPTPADPNFA